jgi:F-type H+-transporting ATPase subunit gamma
MKMIAAARLKKIQQQTLKSRAYAEHIKGMVLSVAERSGESYHPLMAPRKDGKNVDWVVVTSDRGLCGSLNENLMRRLMSSLEEYEGNGKEYSFAKVFGRKGEQFLKGHKMSCKNVVTGCRNN